MISGIYSITNNANGKRYVGQSVNIKRRWYEHMLSLENNTHNNVYLQRSWNKYGSEVFDFTILESCSQIDLNHREEHYIQVLDSYNTDYGYNLTLGGDGSVGFKHSDETKELISQLQIGKKLKESTKRKISERHKGKMPKNIDMLLDNNIKLKLPVLQFGDGGKMVGEWESVNDCARGLKTYATNVVKCLKKKHNTCMGYVLVYKSSWENTPEQVEEVKQRFKKVVPGATPVVRLSLQGEYIDEKPSIAAYVRDGFSKYKITKCCKGEIYNDGDFIWVYKKDYQENKFILN